MAGLLSPARRGTGFARFLRALGRGILRGAPPLMKGLSIAGTVAMFLVGGGILTHGIPPCTMRSEHLLAGLGAAAAVARAAADRRGRRCDRRRADARRGERRETAARRAGDPPLKAGNRTKAGAARRTGL